MNCGSSIWIYVGVGAAGLSLCVIIAGVVVHRRRQHHHDVHGGSEKLITDGGGGRPRVYRRSCALALHTGPRFSLPLDVPGY